MKMYSSVIYLLVLFKIVCSTTDDVTQTIDACSSDVTITVATQKHRETTKDECSAVRTGKRGPKGDVGVKGAKGDPAAECDCLKNKEIANWMDNLKVSVGRVADLRREAILPEERNTDTLHMEVISRGCNDGVHANIFVNGVERRGPTYRRSYNFVVIDPLTKAISTQAFDTYKHHNLIDKMNDYIDGIPIGSIVAVAVRDAVQRRIQRQLGVAYIKSSKFR